MHAIVLKYIDQVARSGSMRRAAEVLNVAASAVNRQIIKLEQEIGVQLFERRANGVSVTPAGEFAVRHARETLERWEELRSNVAALSGHLRGDVHVTTIPSVLVDILPRAIKAAGGDHPGIRFHIVNSDVNTLANEMRAGGPDVALLFMDRRFREYEIVDRLGAKLGVLMRPDHPLARKASLTLTECAAYPVLMLNGPWFLDQISETEFAESGAEFKTRISTNSLSLAKRAILDGLTIGFFTPTGFVNELKNRSLVHVPLSEARAALRDIGLFVHRARKNLAHVRALTDEIVKSLALTRAEIAGARASAEARPGSRRTRRR